MSGSLTSHKFHKCLQVKNPNTGDPPYIFENYQLNSQKNKTIQEGHRKTRKGEEQTGKE